MELECKMVKGSDGMIYFMEINAECPYTDLDDWEQWHAENCVAQFWDDTLVIGDK